MANKNITPYPYIILIVEDSLTQAENLRYLLELHGYQVLVAEHGGKALEIVSKQKPDLIITDINMPEMNGYELCQHIKDDKENDDIPVISLTELSNPEDVLEGLECGADSFISKPFSKEYLLAHIQQLLANWKMRSIDRVRVGVEILFAGKRRFISADQQQMLGLLLSTYEAAIQRNSELLQTQDELNQLNDSLEDKIAERTAALSIEIAERKNAEEEIKKLNNILEERVLERTKQLTQANKELESFSYSVSHDLRAPLRAINGFSEIIVRSYSDNLTEDAQKCFSNIIESSHRMEQLIDDLLQYSRLGRNGVSIGPIQLTEIFNQIKGDFKKENDKLTIPDDFPDILSNRTLLIQIFSNLLENAFKYHELDKSADVAVTWQNEDNGILFKVIDQGIGIREEYFGKIFNVFQRLHNQYEYPGTGIGLANVMKSVQLLGGRIHVESEVGKGSTFIVWLPEVQK